MKAPTPRIIITKAQTQALCKELLKQPLVALDTEWTDYDKAFTPVHNGLALCITLCWRDSEEILHLAYVHNYGDSSGNIYELRPWLESPKNAIIGHNTPVDWHIIANHGIHCRAFNYDTLVLDWLIDENRENMHGLKQCALDHLKHKRLDYEETFGTPKLKKDGTPYANGAREPISLAEVLEQRGGFEKLVDYACADALDTWLLYELFRPQLEALPWMNEKSMWDYYEQRETKLLEAIIQIERRGLPLDVPFIRLMHEKAVHDQELTEAALLELVGVPMKIGSGKQLAALLYGNPDEPQYFERKEEDENQEEGKRRRKKKVDFYLRGLGLPVLRQTEKKAPSTKAEHIAELVRWAEKQDALDLQPDTLDILHHIQAFNGRKTQISTFLEGLPNMARRNGRVHGRIVRTGATSGRFASSQPNLQNLTTGKKDVYHIRDAICAPPGYCLIVADFSQLEYRLLAHMSKEPKLIELFRQGWDLHSMTCVNIFPHIREEVTERFGGVTTEALDWIAEEYPDERKNAKTLNFELIYGVGYRKLADQLRIPEEEAKRMVNDWFAGYPHVNMWKERVLSTLRTGTPVRTIAGRYRRPVLWRLLHKDRGIRGGEERTLVNAIIQGSAADITNKAMVNILDCVELKELGYAMINQVHDELVGECPIKNYERVVQLLRPLMEHPFEKPLRVPMPVAIGVAHSWATAKV
jgi:DNA polymerase-1